MGAVVSVVGSCASLVGFVAKLDWEDLLSLGGVGVGFGVGR